MAIAPLTVRVSDRELGPALRPGERLTVGWQVEDQVDHEGDEHAGHQDIDDVEEWLSANDEVEGNVLVVGAVQRGTGVHVDLGWPVHYLPLPIL